MDELQTRSNLMRQKPCLSIITVRQLALASTVPKPGHPNAVVQVAPVPSLARRNTGHLNPTIVRVLNHFHCRKAAKAVYLTTILLPVEVVVSGLLFPVIIGIVVLLCSCVYQCHQHYHDFRPYQINYQHKHPAPPPPHHLLRTIHVLRRFDPGQVGVMMSPEEADRLGLKPFGDGGAENETSPRLGATGPFWSLRRLRRGGGVRGAFDAQHRE